MESDLEQQLKIPPHSIEAEQAVLGGLMLDNDAWIQVADRIHEGDFYRHDHQLIFRSIKTLAEEGRPCDAVTLSEWLDKQQLLEQAGHLAYLGVIVNNTPSAANITSYADIVREYSVLRQLAKVGVEISNSAFNPEGRDIDELLDYAERKVFEIAEQGQREGGFQAIKNLLTQAVDRIDTLFHSNNEITGLSTGYTDLDAQTSGLQPADMIVVAGRPSMGKCIVAGSRILNPQTGALELIDDMVAKGQGHLVSLGTNLKLMATTPSEFVNDGIKPVFQVQTALGREISTTLSHPFLTLTGWKKLTDIQVGDFVAVPRVLPFFGQETVAPEKIKLLAYLISDGNLTGNSPRFTNKNARLREDYINALQYFKDIKWRLVDNNGTRVPEIRIAKNLEYVALLKKEFANQLTIQMQQQGFTLKSLADKLAVNPVTIHQWKKAKAVPNSIGMVEKLCQHLNVSIDVLFKHGWQSYRSSTFNSVTGWLQSLNLMGQSSHQKRVPNVVFKLSKIHIALFLNRLFACDGSVYIQNQDQIGLSYASVNHDLAQDIQHLLLRFGILAKLRFRQVKYKDTYRPYFELRITHQHSVQVFLNEIGIFGKEDKVKEAQSLSQQKIHKSNLDLLPLAIWDLIVDAKGDLSWADLARKMGRKPKHNFHVGKRRISRWLLDEIATALNHEGLKNLANSDLYWDEVVAISPQGEQQVYDLCVDNTHNFVAEDFLVHNTTFAINIAENVAIKEEKPVAVFSMEMPGEQLAMRMISSLGRIDQNKVRSGKLDDDDWPRLTSAISMLSDKQFYIDDSPALSPTELRARSRRLARECGQLGLIVIDYMQLMQVPGNKENRATEVGEISRSLKSLAKELNVPIIALSQLNRSLEQRPDKRPKMADLRESGCLMGDSLVTCAKTGQAYPIKSLLGRTDFSVWALDESDMKLKSAPVSNIFSTGVKSVWRLTTQLGRTICATANHPFYNQQGWTRLDQLEVGEYLAVPKSQQVNSDVYWDKIVTIEAIGEAEVYDLTVPKLHNFVVNDMIAHNSIEQDADLIMFIYRDEVYDPDSEAKGTAEIIIGKQRNGPIGTVRLAFQGKYTKFENYSSSNEYYPDEE